MDVWHRPDLAGQVALVTGATRGVGRGISEVLAECGATVYVVGRGGQPVDDVVRGIRSRGYRAEPAPCDLRDDAAIRQVLRQVDDEQGRLDILVNNAVGWSSGADADNPFMSEPPWFAPPSWWDDNFTVGVRSHYAMTTAAAPMIIRERRGLVVFTSERQPDAPGFQELVLDLRATAVARMNAIFALHLRPHQVASLLLYPGFVRTEAVEAAFRAHQGYFASWSEDDYLNKTGSVTYAGRAVAALAAAPDFLERTGQVISAYEAATTFGFTDVTGLRPNPA